MAHRVKALAANPDDQISVHGTHMVERENCLSKVAL